MLRHGSSLSMRDERVVGKRVHRRPPPPRPPPPPPRPPPPPPRAPPEYPPLLARAPPPLLERALFMLALPLLLTLWVCAREPPLSNADPFRVPETSRPPAPAPAPPRLSIVLARAPPAPPAPPASRPRYESRACAPDDCPRLYFCAVPLSLYGTAP